MFILVSDLWDMDYDFGLYFSILYTCELFMNMALDYRFNKRFY